MRRVSAAQLLADLPLVPTKVYVSRPVETRLEQMVVDLMERARDLGDVTRGELVGTLLLAREVDDDLVANLRRYRGAATVGDALPGRSALTLQARRRGRPRRRVR